VLVRPEREEEEGQTKQHKQQQKAGGITDSDTAKATASESTKLEITVA
jgi:hypothetical protein